MVRQQPHSPAAGAGGHRPRRSAHSALARGVPAPRAAARRQHGTGWRSLSSPLDRAVLPLSQQMQRLPSRSEGVPRQRCPSGVPSRLRGRRDRRQKLGRILPCGGATRPPTPEPCSPEVRQSLVRAVWRTWRAARDGGRWPCGRHVRFPRPRCTRPEHEMHCTSMHIGRAAYRVMSSVVVSANDTALGSEEARKLRIRPVSRWLPPRPIRRSTHRK